MCGKMIYKPLLGMLMLIGVGQAQADLHQFSLLYSGGAFGNSATATGLITIDDQLTPNPTNDPTFLYLGAGQAVVDLSLVVSGASSGNGVFGLSDFDAVIWDTAGASLDWSSQLIGQATANGGWGTAYDGTVGNFGLLANAASSAPSSISYFEITTNNGNGDALDLVSILPLPAPSMAWLFAGSALGLLTQRRR